MTVFVSENSVSHIGRRVTFVLMVLMGASMSLGHRISHIRVKRMPHDTLVNTASSVSAADRCMSGVT